MSQRVLKGEFRKLLRGRDSASVLRRFSESVAERLEDGLDQGNPLDGLVSRFGEVVDGGLLESIRSIGSNFSDYFFVPKNGSGVTLVPDEVDSIEALPCEQVFFSGVFVSSPDRSIIGLDRLVDGEELRSMELGMRQYKVLNDYWIEYRADDCKLKAGVEGLRQVGGEIKTLRAKLKESQEASDGLRETDFVGDKVAYEQMKEDLESAVGRYTSELSEASERRSRLIGEVAALRRVLHKSLVEERIRNIIDDPGGLEAIDLSRDRGSFSFRKGYNSKRYGGEVGLDPNLFFDDVDVRRESSGDGSWTYIPWAAAACLVACFGVYSIRGSRKEGQGVYVPLQSQEQGEEPGGSNGEMDVKTLEFVSEGEELRWEDGYSLRYVSTDWGGRVAYFGTDKGMNVALSFGGVQIGNVGGRELRLATIPIKEGCKHVFLVDEKEKKICAYGIDTRK